MVIESFEPEYTGYEGRKEKIHQEFKKHNIDANLKTFYLDCDSYLDAEEKVRMYEFLDTVSIWNPELILVYDDQAAYSIMACKHHLIREIPVVFDGVNFPNWELLKQYPNITGFWDKPEYMKTVQLGETIFGPMYFNIWTDNTFLGRKTTKVFLDDAKNAGIERVNEKLFTIDRDGAYSFTLDSITTIKDKSRILKKPAKTKFRLIDARESTSSGLLWSLSGLARYTVFVQSKRDFASKRLGLFANGPTLSVVNEGFGLKEGILGGYLTSPETQICQSVNLATEILQGKKVEDIPIIPSPKEYLLDWTEIERWNISKSSIPGSFHIIKMPFYERYKLQIIIIGILTGIAIILIISYLIYLYLRENRNKQIAQENLKKGERFLSLALTGGKVYAFQFRDNMFSFDKEFYIDAGIEEKMLPTDEFKACVHPANLENFNNDVINARQGKIQKNISQIRCNFDGKGYQWWEFRYTYNLEEDIFNGLCLNIQQSKEAEQELINARQKAEESDKMKSAFLANMSHEIRTPLNAIVGFSNIIAEEEEVELSTEERKEFLGLINSNSELLLKLINDILDLSRIESGKMDFSFKSCNLTDLMKNIYHTHQVLMPAEVKLQIDIPEKPIVIETDALRLTQVITNFINNASKFTHEGYIRIGYTYDITEETVDIYVKDTGIGIPKEKQQAVFERFNKLDEFAQGTGLGLAICQVIIKRFGGEIRLQSEKGKGSCFTIALPL
ncbi:sensor histidine kinase [Parabacteroides faecis]|uniref:histidine kinase n=2 Tax=Parabacteroides faecis TaxID=1217282 RepID=A0ABR6KUX2_9BACT|nr:HAMP domain-containing sensor histidine kinase [Parabacteroides faecis]MBB4624614.1 signal transduction histidine kinase [Parabacteroides faecis]GGK12858.1 sensor histidine kinase [Parabacteroides faecis]